MLKPYSNFGKEKALLLVSHLEHHAATAIHGLPVLRVQLTDFALKALKYMQILAESMRLNSWLYLSSLLVLYLALVQVLRFRNVRKVNKKYAAYLGSPYSMDYHTAHLIMRRFMLYETPFIYAFSTQWALLKTYAVAPGTSLLVATRQLTSDSTVGKRAEDTAIILTEFLIGGLDSDRGSKALAKMNWLHRRYGNKIRQPEMLHTLALFVLEPMRWIERFEWRKMTKLEKVAVFVYWREIGYRMGMNDLPKTLEELEDWVREYESGNIYYTDNNKACAEATMGLFLRDLPPFMRRFGQDAAVSLFEDYIREALGYEKPPVWTAKLVETVFKARGFMIRHLFLPRFREIDALAKAEGGSDRLQRKVYAFEPWYVKWTLWNWLSALVSTSGKVLPGKKYKSEGYLVEELGPAEYEIISKEKVLSEANQLKIYGSQGGSVGLGCPFKFKV